MRQFTEPAVEVCSFTVEDIITTSGIEMGHEPLAANADYDDR